jgi:hypothetical protein
MLIIITKDTFNPNNHAPSPKMRNQEQTVGLLDVDSDIITLGNNRDGLSNVNDNIIY